MRSLIDSNVWIYAAGGVKPAVEFLDTAVHSEWAGYSTITRLELYGYPDLKAEDEEKLQRLLGLFTEMEVDSSVIDRAIQIRKEKVVKVPDAIIAATALLMNADLVTHNTVDFEGISGLRILNPFEAAG